MLLCFQMIQLSGQAFLRCLLLLALVAGFYLHTTTARPLEVVFKRDATSFDAPTKPEHFATVDELYDYLKTMREYYDLMARPR